MESTSMPEAWLFVTCEFVNSFKFEFISVHVDIDVK